MTKQSSSSHQVRPVKTIHVAGIPLIRVDVTDRYHLQKYAIERKIIQAFLGSIEWYLRRNPELEHESVSNISRYLIYLPSGMRAWRHLMPGGFATYHVHNPHVKKMKNGASLDAITRAFFRHSIDAIGLRSRASIMSWIAEKIIQDTPGDMRWLSIAAGSGQPVFDACRALAPDDRKKLSIVLTDIDQGALAFARELYDAQKAELTVAQFIVTDITDPVARKKLLTKYSPHLIDIMGLFEYLSDEQCVELLGVLYSSLQSGGAVIFTNMSPGHPHLHIHQRGLGWPGVIQRTIHEVAGLMQEAGIPKSMQTVYRAGDNVYNVYVVVKA